MEALPFDDTRCSDIEICQYRRYYMDGGSLRVHMTCEEEVKEILKAYSMFGNDFVAMKNYFNSENYEPVFNTEKEFMSKYTMRELEIMLIVWTERTMSHGEHYYLLDRDGCKMLDSVLAEGLYAISGLPMDRRNNFVVTRAIRCKFWCPICDERIHRGQLMARWLEFFTRCEPIHLTGMDEHRKDEDKPKLPPSYQWDIPPFVWVHALCYRGKMPPVDAI